MIFVGIMLGFYYLIFDRELKEMLYVFNRGGEWFGRDYEVVVVWFDGEKILEKVEEDDESGESVCVVVMKGFYSI